MTIHKRLRLVSWNVNGIRAVHKKGALRWWLDEKPEILCLQETKADESQIPLELRNIPGYHAYYASGVRKGYSGAALYTQLKPARMRFGFGSDEFDREGRVIAADVPCRGCLRKRCRHVTCMELIDPRAVVSAAEEMLSREGR